MSKKFFPLLFLLISTYSYSQTPVDFSHFNKKGTATATAKGNTIELTWPTGEAEEGRLLLNLENGKPLFQDISLAKGDKIHKIVEGVDPAFILTVGKRDLTKPHG